MKRVLQYISLDIQYTYQASFLLKLIIWSGVKLQRQIFLMFFTSSNLTPEINFQFKKEKVSLN